MIQDYTGIPWRPKGRDRSTGLDCWGLLCLVFRKERNIELPEYGGIDPSDEGLVRDLFSHDWPIKGFREVTGNPWPMDVILFRVLGSPTHVGVVADKCRVLHMMEGAGSCIIRLDDPRWSRRIEGVYRYEE